MKKSVVGTDVSVEKKTAKKAVKKINSLSDLPKDVILGSGVKTEGLPVDAVLSPPVEPSISDRFTYHSSANLRRSIPGEGWRRVKAGLSSEAFDKLCNFGKALGVTWDEYLRALIDSHTLVDLPTCEVVEAYLLD